MNNLTRYTIRAEYIYTDPFTYWPLPERRKLALDMIHLCPNMALCNSALSEYLSAPEEHAVIIVFYDDKNEITKIENYIRHISEEDGESNFTIEVFDITTPKESKTIRYHNGNPSEKKWIDIA